MSQQNQNHEVSISKNENIPVDLVNDLETIVWAKKAGPFLDEKIPNGNILKTVLSEL